MKNPPANDHEPKTLSFSPFVSSASAVSRYHVDVYGRPRILSKWEVTLYALARPVVIGAVVGLGLAIALLVIHNSAMPSSREKTGCPQVASLEAAP